MKNGEIYLAIGVLIYTIALVIILSILMHKKNKKRDERSEEATLKYFKRLENDFTYPNCNIENR